MSHVRRIAAVMAVLVLTQSLALADTFTNVKLMVNTGDSAEEQDAVLRFEADRLVVYGKGGVVLKTMPFAEIRAAEYSYSKSPRWKSGIGAAIAVGVFAIPIFFMKGKKHWLTIAGEHDFAVLRLDKKNYRLILPTFETRTGKRVETVADEK
jgi:hypothetical protein